MRNSQSNLMTIEQELQALGFGHRRLPNSINTGKHEIYSLKTGQVFGQFQALEALEFAKGVSTWMPTTEKN